MSDYIEWAYCESPNDINRVIAMGDPLWRGLESAEQIISITFNAYKGCYVVFWRVKRSDI